MRAAYSRGAKGPASTTPRTLACQTGLRAVCIPNQPLPNDAVDTTLPSCQYRTSVGWLACLRGSEEA